MSFVRRLDADALHEQPWANGTGSTLLIDSGPDPDQWQWRLSMARIEHDGPFSTLPDTRRAFVPLDAPIRLRFQDGRERELLRLSLMTFDGDDAPHAELVDGATRAFNLMLRGDAQAQLIARPLNGSMLLPVRANTRWYVHLLSGRAQLHVADETYALDSGDHVWVVPGPGTRTQLEGGGEVILVELSGAGAP
jgi:environmental stress-induced protein Ves